MKKFIGYFKDFHQDYYNTKLYAIVLVFISILITVNYQLKLEKGYINSFAGSSLQTILYLLLYAFSFYGVLLIIYLFDKDRLKVGNGFWWKSLIGLILLALDRSTHPQISALFFTLNDSYCDVFWYNLSIYGGSMITTLLPLAILKLLMDSHEKFGIYGLRFKQVDFKAYNIMLLCMVPLVFAASFIPDFLTYYPVYRKSGGELFSSMHGISELYSKILFQFFYITDYLNTELFFRGFLIIGLSKLLGKNVVLPMVACYAVLHFGKPLGETISSVFGGYILGVIALYSRNIWGGVYLHAGIALLMELFAMWQEKN